MTGPFLKAAANLSKRGEFKQKTVTENRGERLLIAEDGNGVLFCTNISLV